MSRTTIYTWCRFETAVTFRVRSCSRREVASDIEEHLLHSKEPHTKPIAPVVALPTSYPKHLSHGAQTQTLLSRLQLTSFRRDIRIESGLQHQFALLLRAIEADRAIASQADMVIPDVRRFDRAV